MVDASLDPVIKVGCCGFPLARRRYFEAFKLVEVQQTFYQPPQAATVARWRAEAPPDFEFVVKAWQLITHPATSPTYRRLKIVLDAGKGDRYGFFRPTDEVLAAWEATLETARLLGARLVLLQSPASFRPTEENVTNLHRFVGSINRHGVTLVWEPRGAWPEDLIVTLCQEMDLVPCVDPFKQRPLAGSIRYFRLHGQTGYKYRYTASELAALLEMCREPGPKVTYCLFNNAHMLADAQEFLKLVAG